MVKLPSQRRNCKQSLDFFHEEERGQAFLIVVVGKSGCQAFTIKKGLRFMAYGLWLKNAKPYRKKICQVSKPDPFKSKAS